MNNLPQPVIEAIEKEASESARVAIGLKVPLEGMPDSFKEYFRLTEDEFKTDLLKGARLYQNYLHGLSDNPQELANILLVNCRRIEGVGDIIAKKLLDRGFGRQYLTAQQLPQQGTEGKEKLVKEMEAVLNNARTNSPIGGFGEYIIRTTASICESRIATVRAESEADAVALMEWISENTYTAATTKEGKKGWLLNMGTGGDFITHAELYSKFKEQSSK